MKEPSPRSRLSAEELRSNLSHGGPWNPAGSASPLPPEEEQEEEERGRAPVAEASGVSPAPVAEVGEGERAAATGSEQSCWDCGPLEHDEDRNHMVPHMGSQTSVSPFGSWSLRFFQPTGQYKLVLLGDAGVGKTCFAKSSVDRDGAFIPGAIRESHVALQ